MDATTKQLFANLFKDPIGAIYRALVWMQNDPSYPSQTILQSLRNGILLIQGEDRDLYRDEIEFVKHLPLEDLTKIVFPYPMVGSRCPVSVFRENGFPYVLHGGQKLFFPKSFTDAKVEEMYGGYVNVECLLGDGACVKKPHSYVADDHQIENGDILIDVGCAEALFSLHNVNCVSHAYLFEGDRAWFSPLEQTFGKYKDRVNIIKQYVGPDGVDLADVLPDDRDTCYFIKMDIEGAERSVLVSLKQFLQTHRVKISCCLYHRQDDQDHIVPFLRECGYTVKLSEGYMVPPFGGVHYPFFRKGMAYARNY